MTKYLLVIALLMLGCKGEVTQTDIESATGLQFLTVPKGSVLVENKEGDLEWICPNSSVELSGEIVDLGIDYSQITVDTSRVLSICFDDRMHCDNTMQLKGYVAYKKEEVG